MAEDAIPLLGSIRVGGMDVGLSQIDDSGIESTVPPRRNPLEMAGLDPDIL